MFLMHSSYSKSHTLMLLSLIVIKMSLLGMVYIDVTLSITLMSLNSKILTPMAFVYYTKLSLGDIYEIDIHVL